jgi:hypothetical protein
MPFTPTRNDNPLLRRFETIKVLGLTLPLVDNYLSFAFSEQQEILDLFVGFGHIVAGAKETGVAFTFEASNTSLFYLRFFAAWSRHPQVDKRDRVTYSQLEEAMNPEMYAEIREAVNQIMLPVMMSVSGKPKEGDEEKNEATEEIPTSE